MLLRLGILATWQRCSVDIPGTGNVESMRGGEGWTALFGSWRYTRWMAPVTYTSGGPSTYLPDRDGWYESDAGKVWERRIDGCGEDGEVQAAGVGLDDVQTNSLGGAPNFGG